MDDIPAAPVPSLPALLAQYNSLLGWTQSDLARATRMDQSVVNKIMTGRVPRPHPSTLMRISTAYQRAGLNVTLDHLLAARDRGQSDQDNPWNIPPHFVRLVQSVMAHDRDFQDAVYRAWSAVAREMAQLVSPRFEPPDGYADIDEKPP